MQQLVRRVSECVFKDCINSPSQRKHLAESFGQTSFMEVADSKGKGQMAKGIISIETLSSEAYELCFQGQSWTR